VVPVHRTAVDDELPRWIGPHLPEYAHEQCLWLVSSAWMAGADDLTHHVALLVVELRGSRRQDDDDGRTGAPGSGEQEYSSPHCSTNSAPLDNSVPLHRASHACSASKSAEGSSILPSSY